MRILIVAPLFQEWYVGRFILRAAELLGLEALSFDFRFPFKLRDVYIYNIGIDALWYWYFFHGIVNKVYFGKYFRNSFIRNVNKRLIKLTENFHPELVLVCEGELLSEASLKKIKIITGSKLVFWTFDDPQLIERHLKIAPFFDYCFTNSLNSVQTYRESGNKAEYIPGGCDPGVHKRVPLDKLEPNYLTDVCIYAGFHPKRYTYLRILPNVRLGIWGMGWNKLPKSDILRKNWKGPIVRLIELVKMYSGAKIALNIQRTETTLTTTTNRIWEATACGVMLLTERVAGIDLAFNVGEEVICYESMNDLKEKVVFYLDNEEMRKKIASRGQLRCIRDHTISNRLKKIIEICK